MKTMFQNVLCLFIGLIVGYFVGCSKGKLDIIETTKVETRVDTLVKVVKVKIPVPERVYITRTDSIFELITDSVFVERFHDLEEDSIPVNLYRDTIIDPDYQLRYNIATFGQLLDFNYDIDLYRKIETVVKYKKPNWMLSGAVSDKLNYKLGFGYQGWTVEGEFKRGFNQLYIGKQIFF